MVEMLNVEAPSPPVPQVSSSGSPPGPQSMGAAISRMARANPTNSSTVSPFIRKATRNAAICGWLAWPDSIVRMASNASPDDRSTRDTTRSRYGKRAMI